METDKQEQEERIFITPEEAFDCLHIDDNEVHCFLNPNGALIGMEWGTNATKELLSRAETIEIGGDNCMDLGHGIVVYEKNIYHFLEHDKEKIKKYLEVKNNEIHRNI